MAGVDDQVVGVDGHARWFHDALPHSELRLVPGRGHMVHHAVPDQVADVIAAVMDARWPRSPSQGDRAAGCGQWQPSAKTGVRRRRDPRR
jgi:pimeloyl-ACP methyl ester carboxylesterase